MNLAAPLEMDHPKNEYHPEKNQLSLGDGGLWYFYLTSWGTVETVFEGC